MLGAEQVKTLLRNAVLGLAGAALMIVTGVASAAESTTTFQVSASVVANCLVSANNLPFGTYDPTAADRDVDTTVLVRCTNGTGYTVALNAGVTAGATLAQRLMVFGGTNFMNYNLYTTAGRTVIFGDGTGGTAMISGTGTGLGIAQQQTVDVFGRIPAGQFTLPIGTYTETTITVTVTF